MFYPVSTKTTEVSTSSSCFSMYYIYFIELLAYQQISNVGVLEGNVIQSKFRGILGFLEALLRVSNEKRNSN